MGTYKSKEDDVAKISTTVYVTNFPESISAKELFHSCKVYGHVVDSFIAIKRAKNGKIFGFVPFINVFSEERLVNNLYENKGAGESMNAKNNSFSNDHVLPKGTGIYEGGNSYAKVLKGDRLTGDEDVVKSPTVVLDDVCLMTRDLSNAILGRVNEFTSLANLKMTLCNEGFVDIKIQYMGEFWVMMEFANKEMIKKFRDNEDSCFHSKRLCIYIKLERSISKEFKIIHHGKIYWIRAKETLGWVSDFAEELDDEDLNEVNSNDDVDKDQDPNLFEGGGCDNKSEGSLKYLLGFSPKECNEDNSVHVGADIYLNEDGNALNKSKRAEGFTTSRNNKDHMKSKDDSTDSVSLGHFKKSEAPRTGGSILGLLDEVVKFGKIMGYKMKGCMSNMAEIIEVQGAKEENVTMSDSFVMVSGVWRSTGQKYMLIAVYAQHDTKDKHMLWDYLQREIRRWKGEVNLGGCSFTWCHKSASKMSKMDRFLISDSLVNTCSNINAITLERYLSDHRPILLREAYFDYGPIPFKIFHYWFEMDGFNKMVEDAWKEGVMVDGTWIDNPNRVKREFFDHFNARFCQPSHKGTTIQMEFPKKLLDEEIWEIECNVTNDKIKRAVWDCGTYKAPGPNGFTFGFFRRFWDLIKCDVFDAVRYFFMHCDILKGYNPSFIALIPKNHNANLVRDFRPISLIGSLYKIIAKMLANRLVGVLNGIVNEVQSAFIVDRQILDGPFILNEVIQWCKSKHKQALIFKVDFKKAYDSVRWDFLDDVLRKFGFGDKWCKWIQCCLWSSRGSILVNGSHTKEFQFGKGLKQGDLLSLFLFILVVESLHLSFQRIVDAGRFYGIKISGGLVNLSHMFYADDAVFIGQWCESKIMGVHMDGDMVKSTAGKLGKKATWVNWKKALLSKERGRLRVSCLYAMNRGVNSRVGITSCWMSITKETNMLSMKGIDLMQYMRIKVGNGESTAFWEDKWCDEGALKDRFPRVYALESCKHIMVAAKFSQPTLSYSFRRHPRGSTFRVEVFLLILFYALIVIREWRHQGIFFSCCMAREVMKLIARWWNVPELDFDSYEEWLAWFANVRLPLKNKKMLEGVFYVLWWLLWWFRNKTIFEGKTPKKAMFF
nr:RNA-directed DNA polymerase, eukaryota, reverse transcriptase zinc-binding domain protein [Tanacetum cinerariifolium]